MMRQLRGLLTRYPRLKACLKFVVGAFRRVDGVSSGYERLDQADAANEACRLRLAWQNEALPDRQRELVETQLQAFRSGGAVDVFDTMVRALRELPVDVRGMSVLEIGCSSGFYSEVLEIAGLGVAYFGCDYSPAFVAMARLKYPGLGFSVADATALEHTDDAFEIAISGCCLLHIPEYQAAVRETARVASRYAIFHRTPVVIGRPTLYYRKLAYGVETVEIHFNESEFLALLEASGLRLCATYSLSELAHGESGSVSRTYVCEKMK